MNRDDNQPDRSDNSSEFKMILPASAANLGPGFDCLGLALGLHNTFTVRVKKGEHDIVNRGISAPDLNDAKQNLFLQSYDATCLAYDQRGPSLHVEAENNIPLEAGLGSSATAIVGGVAAAYKVLGLPLSRREMLRDAVRLENHPDNVGACLYGGFIVGVIAGDGPLVSKSELGSELTLWITLPDRRVNTKESRRRIPLEIPIGDAVFSLSHAALLTSALIHGRFELLWEAMLDRIHEPFRMDPKLEYPLLKEKLRSAAFYGWAISGSGPAVVTFCKEVTPQMEAHVKGHFQERGVAYRDLRLKVDNVGLQILPV